MPERDDEQSELPILPLTVEVLEPEQLYFVIRYLARDKVHQPYRRLISQTPFRDKIVLQGEETHVIAAGAHGGFRPDREDYYTIISQLRLAKTQQEREDHGYYSADRAASLANLLSKRNWQVETAEVVDSFGTKLFLTFNATTFELDLGPRNQLADQAFRAALAGRLGVQPQPKAPHKLRNERLRLQLIASRQPDVGNDRYLRLGECGATVEALNLYAHALEDTIRALYQEANTLPPERSIWLGSTIFPLKDF